MRAGGIDTRHDRDSLTLSVVLPCPREDAWALITNEEEIARWWGDYVTLDARPGGRFEERWQDGRHEVVARGQVIGFEPSRLLRFTWADEGWPGVTEVELRLDEAPGGCRLTLTQEGWNAFPRAQARRLIDRHSAGWRSHLEALARVAAEGR
ncbi:MAG: SRPBCC family protein [Kiloniellales bacterium]